MDPTKPWWTNVDLFQCTSHQDGAFNYEAVETAIRVHALYTDKTVHYSTPGGTLKNDAKSLISKLEGLGGRLVYQRSGSVGSENDSDLLLVWDHGAISLHIDSDSWVNVNCCTMDKEFNAKFLAIAADEVVSTATRPGRAYMFVTTPSGLQVKPLKGHAGVPMVRGNYAPDVVTQYDHIVSDFKSPTPCGRLVILEGPPGTGKTFFIRALTEEVNNAIFVLVQPKSVESLMDPGNIPALIRAREDSEAGAIILVLEDADSVLVPRAADNMASISSLLNLGDGIFGNLLDIRILATTNATKQDIDPAVLRDGRLCRRIEVGAMSAEQANEIYKSLMNTTEDVFPKEDPTKRKTGFGSGGGPATYTLTQVYNKAHKGGWKPPVNKQPKRDNRYYYPDDY